MKTMQDAVTLSQSESDGFYLTAFVLQCWLGELVVRATAEYAEKKDARDRSMQTGQAWHAFRQLFGGATKEESPQLISQIFRFAQCDDSLAHILQRSTIPLSIELDCSRPGITSWIESCNTIDCSLPTAGQSPQSICDSTFFTRWCDWIDAVIHFQTHAHWHLAPACYDPDPERRELAILGNNQRNLAHLTQPSRDWWQWHFSDAAVRFKDSPKWLTLGKAMSSQTQKLWQYQEPDTLIISLWPLVTRHNWTYRDLLNVIRPFLKRPQGYPCDGERSFATHCIYILGLKKAGKGRSAKNGKPAGYEVARTLIYGDHGVKD